MAASVPVIRLLVRKLTVQKQDFLDEEEGDYVPESSGFSRQAKSKMATTLRQVATWGSTMVSWSSTVTTRDSKESRASLPSVAESVKHRAKLDNGHGGGSL